MTSNKTNILPSSLLLLLLLAATLTAEPSTAISKSSGPKKSKKPVTQKVNVPNRNTTIAKDLSQLNELQDLMRQTVPETASPSTNLTGGVSATKQGPCSCGKGVCSCCSRILLNFLRQRACVNVTYDPDEFAFTAKVSMNDRLLYTRTVSGKNPRPVCVPVPRVPVVTACIRFYNIYFHGRNVHACVNMEGKFRDTTLFKVGMDCLRLGSNGVALVKPEDGGGLGQVELLPDDPDDGANDSSEDDYDGYDDYADDDDGDESDEDEDLIDY